MFLSKSYHCWQNIHHWIGCHIRNHWVVVRLTSIFLSAPITTKIVNVNSKHMVKCTWYNSMWQSLSVTCGRLMIFSKLSWIHPPRKLTVNVNKLLCPVIWICYDKYLHYTINRWPMVNFQFVLRGFYVVNTLENMYTVKKI